MSHSNIVYVDVFESGPIDGNRQTVFLNTENCSFLGLVELVKEMRQFEPIFLYEASRFGATARVFAVEAAFPYARIH